MSVAALNTNNTQRKYITANQIPEYMLTYTQIVLS